MSQLTNYELFRSNTTRRIAMVSLESELSCFAPKMLKIIASKSEECYQLEPGSEPYESINQLRAFPAWIIFPFDTTRCIAKVSLVSELSYFAPKMLDIVGSKSEDCDQLEPGSEPYVSFYCLRAFPVRITFPFDAPRRIAK